MRSRDRRGARAAARLALAPLLLLALHLLCALQPSGAQRVSLRSGQHFAHAPFEARVRAASPAQRLFSVPGPHSTHTGRIHI